MNLSRSTLRNSLSILAALRLRNTTSHAILCVCFVLVIGSHSDAADPRKNRSQFEQALYEARNWMPSASDPPSVYDRLRSIENSKPTFVTSRFQRTGRYRPVQRINLAEYKARIAARAGIHRLAKPGRPSSSIAPVGLRHVGGHLGLGGGFLEGAGFSARSAQEALAVCSYSQYGYPVLYQGVAKGRDGYFAYKIYGR